jgi:aminoglycoside phosphotransferase (APT) family kinase protein
MRREPERGTILPYDIASEYRLLADLRAAGLRVPEGIYLEEDAGALDGRFMLMDYIEGEMYGSNDERLAQDEKLKAKMQRGFVETLAAIHATEQRALPSHADGQSAARAQVEISRRRLSETELLPRPILSHALDVLDRRAPAAPKLVLIHGDYRLPNLKWQAGEVAGILDWELACVGDPMADIAFTLTIGAGHCGIEGDMAALYTELTGTEIDEQRLAYYRLMEMVKATIIGYAAARDLADGGSDLRLMSVAGLAGTAEPICAMLQIALDQLAEA